MKRCVLVVVLVLGTASAASAAMRYNFDVTNSVTTGTYSKVRTREVVRVRTSDQIELGGNGAFRWTFWQRRSAQERFQR